MLVNDRWLELWLGTHYVSLNPRTSDHSPLVLKGELRSPPVMLFRFDNYLASSPSFIPMVHSIWHNQVVGTSMYSVTRKLKALIPQFRQQQVFIQWVEEYVTAPTFSICINGSTHCFFKGPRDDRTRDAFRYHWHCAELSFFQLGFADDLLLFCEAHNPSIIVFQRGLKLFATLSRFHVNPTKSQLILSKAARYDSTRFLVTLSFQEGQLPVKYLGLPLISSRLSLANCRPLLDKINSRIQGWGGISLSIAAWVQLIKSVLMELNTYWAMAFILPKGLGVRDFQSLNLALISRRLWEVRFSWPYRDWIVGINWETGRWRGKHIVNASYRCLLASLTYHVWQE
ncbi:hypothetical protein Sango_2057200 [Sesamum angolense]|uniref:Reverse transcriptase n=1 Tax=Sesamum angolense TaxID=2727404 RepID=A0AAE2BPF2_9LAMI|nr:hypothetical protein Sango_2057200 [Sesamum angolense]